MWVISLNAWQVRHPIVSAHYKNEPQHDSNTKVYPFVCHWSYCLPGVFTWIITFHAADTNKQLVSLGFNDICLHRVLYHRRLICIHQGFLACFCLLKSLLHYVRQQEKMFRVMEKFCSIASFHQGWHKEALKPTYSTTEGSAPVRILQQRRIGITEDSAHNIAKNNLKISPHGQTI